MSTGFYLRVLLPKAEQVAMKAGDAEIAERHLARALVDMLREDLRRQAIDGERLVAEVTAMEAGPEEERIKQALELERLQFSRAQDELWKSAGGESVVAQSDSQRRGILDSSIHVGRITEIHIEMLREMARTWIRIRREVAQTVQPLASSARLKSLRQEIERMVDEQWANLHIAIARWCGGVRTESEIQRFLGTPGYIAKWQEIKDGVARELGILEREASLGMTRAISTAAPPARQSVIINIQGSTVAALNLGTVMGSIQATVATLQQGDPEMATALRTLIEAVVADDSLGDGRRDVIESLSQVGEEATKPEIQRRTGLVKTLLAGVAAALTQSANVAQIWQTFGPAIARYFRLPWP